MLPSPDDEGCQDPDKRSARRTARQHAVTRRRPPLLVQQRWSTQIDSFFFARQRALQAPPVHLDAKPCLDLLETLRSCQPGACSPEIGHKGNYLGRDLVAILGTALTRQRGSQPRLF